jgi:phytoene desaturase
MATTTSARSFIPETNRSPTRGTVGIIGGGLGGLSAAIHLQAAGYCVTLLEAGERVGGRANRIEVDGFSFDTGPSLLNYPWVFRDVFAAAGRDLSDYVELLPVEPSVRFQWPDGAHLQLSSRLDALLQECERLEPGVGPRLMAYLADAGAKYRLAFDKLVSRNADSALQWFGRLTPGEMARLGVWHSLYAELRRFFKSRYILEALGSYGMYLGGSPYELPGFFSILPYGELAYGLWLPRGGVYGLVRGMERLADELGADIRTGTRVEQVVVEAGAAKGVALAGGETLRFDAIVSNVDVPTTLEQLIAPSALRRGRKPPRMTSGVLTFYWGVRGRLPGAGHHTIFLPDDYAGCFRQLMRDGAIPDGLPFYMSIASETDPSLAPAGDSAVFVLVPTPVLSALGDVDWTAETPRLRTRVLERLQGEGIDLTPERIAVERVLTPADWRDRFGLFDGSAFGAAHGLFQVGPFRSPNQDPEIAGLFYTGASTTPGTGMPMVVLSGKLAAERVGAYVH